MSNRATDEPTAGMVPAHQVPWRNGLRKVGRSEGEVFDLVGARFTWKVKGDDTGFAFSIYEQELAPGEGVPRHCHAYAEAFYVVVGVVHFLRATEKGEDWIACTDGEVIIVPINALHAFYNRTDKLARLLSVSTQLHQAFFDAAQEADRAFAFAAMPHARAMARISKIAQRFEMHFFPATGHEAARNT